MKTLKVKLDDKDHEAVMEAVAIRKSGLFRIDGVLIMPDGESDAIGALIAEVCRGWTERVSADVVGMARAATLREAT